MRTPSVRCKQSRQLPGGRLGWVVILGLLALPVVAQKSKQQLEKDKKLNQQRLAETSRILRETSEQRRANLGQLQALQQQISSRTRLIGTIAEEVTLLERDVRELAGVANAMEADIAQLKAEYGAMVYAAAKGNTYYNKLLFLFSAPTFTQLAMRFRYLRQYTEARKNQVKQIEKIRLTLTTQREKIGLKRMQKEKLLTVQLTENRSLLTLKTQQSAVVQQLSQRETQLRDELAETQRADARLERLITDLVEEEIRRTEATRRANSAKEDNNAIGLTAETAALASSFANNKTKLPWPVQSGFIAGRFGRHEHALLKGVYVDNLGVSIQTNRGEAVRTVFDGVVLSVADIPRLNRIVTIQHGDYITVYANLSKVSVKANQRLRARDVVGEVYTDRDGVSQLQFQIWKNQDRFDPEAWLHDK